MARVRGRPACAFSEAARAAPDGGWWSPFRGPVRALLVATLFINPGQPVTFLTLTLTLTSTPIRIRAPGYHYIDGGMASPDACSWALGATGAY